jgi:hypothetical protein
LASAATLWRVFLGALAVAALLVVRSCGYELNTVASYAGYFAFYVALPGAVVMYFINRGPLSFANLIALGLPTGFAIEIFTYLGLSAIGAKAAYAWSPLAWIGLLMVLRATRGEWPVRVRISAHHAGLSAGLAIAFLATAVMAAGQMFAESPLAEGLPTRAIFHDWVYLVSRAAVIKNTWPLEDPSLSGTPLQYHYFMMVHAAAASWTTGVELTAVMLRLIFVPLGAVLVAQSYVLGRMLSRSPWGGVIASLLTVMSSELSLAPSYGQPMFLGLFVRWLFVSPTFFFGMIFCGALLLAIARCARTTRCEVRDLLWLLLLGTAGTGAKGTVLPVLLCALALWAAWCWWKERRLPVRLVVFGACLAVAFALVYVPTMWAWRSGDAAWRPFHVFQLTQFWKEYLPRWQAGLATWLPTTIATPLAIALCATVVFIGTCGVRLLAVPYLFWGDLEKRDRRLASWLGAFFIASAGMGLLMELNSYGELYLVLMVRLPMSVLTAAFFIAAARRVTAWWRTLRMAPSSVSASPFAVQTPHAARRRAVVWSWRIIVGAGAVVSAVALALQTSLWITRNQAGLGQWLSTPTDLKPDDYMQQLQEALLWVRKHTEPDAVLVANAFTPENMKKDHWGALDRTLMGVHFYYSALSERRLWFEGPNYILDTTSARARASLAANFFYRHAPLSPKTVSSGPCYALIDRTLADGAQVRLGDRKVFANARIEIYRLTEPKLLAEKQNHVATASAVR